jgi:hypothetical protein
VKPYFMRTMFMLIPTSMNMNTLTDMRIPMRTPTSMEMVE